MTGYVDAIIHFSTPYEMGEKVAGVLMVNNGESVEYDPLSCDNYFIEAEGTEEDVVKFRIPQECMVLLKEKIGTIAVLSKP